MNEQTAMIFTILNTFEYVLNVSISDAFRGNFKFVQVILLQILRGG